MEVPQEWRARLTQPGADPELHLPKENPFIPTDFTMLQVSVATTFASEVRCFPGTSPNGTRISVSCCQGPFMMTRAFPGPCRVYICGCSTLDLRATPIQFVFVQPDLRMYRQVRREDVGSWDSTTGQCRQHPTKLQLPSNHRLPSDWLSFAKAGEEEGKDGKTVAPRIVHSSDLLQLYHKVETSFGTPKAMVYLVYPPPPPPTLLPNILSPALFPSLLGAL